MPIQGQPPGRRGDIGKPYSALNLRLTLALIGLVLCVGAAALLLRAGQTVLGWVFVAAAVTAAVDVVVVQLRRRARARAGDRGHSLFE